MYFKLGELSTITTGLVVKRKEAAPGVNNIAYKLITLKSINYEGYLDTVALDNFYSIEEIDDKYLTKVGDVIVRLSDPFTAITIKDGEDNLLVSSLFAIVRIKDSNVTPEYLSVYLNSEMLKKHYAKESSGSAVQMIKMSSIKEVQINVLDSKMQNEVVVLNDLMLRESKLLNELKEQKSMYNRQLISEILQGVVKNGN
ncbi:restriction endonuclease subunit S [Desulfuribacillus alkaliarsenatis]|uniref:Uncharacterized protein n=1 Tax=Desulfuribacillus alkaliarsenatis TaxID=766136 RepID=A0A1E5G3W2_9FIRM|nr:restriction endonuclease subunit S [Desulfuribacillus alkaliarsenatis]OEF97359.1 hypothetical protein BHF68_03875 [Desulfuribacillus alkaliarsenatis]